MALRKTQPVAEPLVPIAEVLAHLAGDGSASDTWALQAEELAETMRGEVTRDWRGRPCISWVHAERTLLHLRRNQEQANRERAALAAEAEQDRGVLTGPGVVGIEVPGYRWQAPWVADKFDHGDVEVPG